MTAKPSPRPWRVSETLGHAYIVQDARGSVVAHTETCTLSVRPRHRADAALIVDAVNQFEWANEEIHRLLVEKDNVFDEAVGIRDERDRLRDIVRRLADLSESLLANYEYRYREDVNSMAFVENTRGFLREARAAIGEDAR